MIIANDGSKRFLKADEIECRLGQKSKDGSRYSVLLYKTARTDMDILDEIFGPQNWKSSHNEVKGKDFCTISVRQQYLDRYIKEDGSESFRVSYEWVGKTDCGRDYQRVAEDSDKKGLNEFEKSESSDSFKRAGFQWGIGRELYSAPQIWLDSAISPYSLKVALISYDENDKICDLIITGKKGASCETVFSFHAVSKADMVAEIIKLGGDVEKLKAYFKVDNLEKLDVETLEKILIKGRSKA